MNGRRVTDWDVLRAEFVRIITEECPEVIENLATPISVEEWAEDCGLDVFPWMLEHARNTRKLWEDRRNGMAEGENEAGAEDIVAATLSTPIEN